ncbi:myoneurin-like isoform X2 [Manduca sexta]|uniref:myoneurin-like isoform X2 n=1 Tax=Manduca sexta TaxID=7130 RepID=UPI00188F5555|nr:myoneurin-like isoform X2 [Manduca sexta]
MMDIKQLATEKQLIKSDLDGVMDSCRVCMSLGADMSSLFDTEHINVIDRIEFCTGILLKQDDCLPSKICNVCLSNLSIAYEFKMSCLLANNVFRKFVTPVIKSEAPDDDRKESYKEASMEVDDHLSASNECDDTNVGCQDELSAVHDEKGLKGSIIRDISVTDTEKRVVRKKRGPYKKSKVVKKKKLKPVKKVQLDRLSCSSCKLKFENKEQVIMHKKDYHRDTECWVCEICGKVLTHRASHYSHVRSHAPPQYACAQCDYKTWYKHDLIKHVRRHDGIKLFQCEYCTASYYTSSNLINHTRRVHEGEKRYQCTICEKRFYDRTKLNRHTDSHNEIRRIASAAEYQTILCNSRCWMVFLLFMGGRIAYHQANGKLVSSFKVIKELHW